MPQDDKLLEQLRRTGAAGSAVADDEHTTVEGDMWLKDRGAREPHDPHG
jgi:hypothetical protein